jgi:hypothetical protein
MGGSEALPPGRNPWTLLMYVQSYRGGSYERIYSSAVNELMSCLNVWEATDKRPIPVLCQRLSQKQEYLHGTYENFIFVRKEEVGSRMPEPISYDYDTPEGFATVCQRLSRLGYTKTRKQSELDIMVSIRHDDLMLDKLNSKEFKLEQTVLDRGRRRQYGDALASNTAYSNLIKREASRKDLTAMLQDPGFRVIATGKLTFTLKEARWILKPGEKHYKLKDLTEGQDIFLSSDTEFGTSMRIANLEFKPSSLSGLTITTREKVGSYIIQQNELEWGQEVVDQIEICDRPLKRIEMIRISADSTEWVNDDETLINLSVNHASCVMHRRGDVIVLISNDKSLAKKMVALAGTKVLLIPPDSVLNIHNIRTGYIKQEILGYKSLLTCVDLGSVRVKASGDLNFDVNPKFRIHVNKVDPVYEVRSVYIRGAQVELPQIAILYESPYRGIDVHMPNALTIVN